MILHIKPRQYRNPRLSKKSKKPGYGGWVKNYAYHPNRIERLEPSRPIFLSTHDISVPNRRKTQNFESWQRNHHFSKGSPGIFMTLKN